MQAFTISRLNSAQGIFKIIGSFKPITTQLFTVEITSIEMMGTDGWVLLDPKNTAVINLINNLQPIINNHLKQL